MISSILGTGMSQAATANQLNNRKETVDASEKEPVGQIDRVTISGDAYALLSSGGAEKTAEAAGASSGDLSLTGGLAAHLIYMVNNIEEITQDFQAELEQKLRSQGIDVYTQFQLTNGRDGSVKVSGDHPDKAEIEQYFKDNPEMRDRFVDIAVHTQIKQTLELQTEFTKAYAENAEAAVEKYFPMFAAAKGEHYTMTIGAGAEA